MTKLSKLLGGLALSALFSASANAVIIMEIYDDGTDLTMTATGSYDISSLTPSGSSPLGANAAVAPTIAGGIFGWESDPNTLFGAAVYSGSLSGTSNAFPADFVATTTDFNFNVGSGGVYFSDSAPLIGSVDNIAIFNGVTLASLGMIVGEQIDVSWAGDSAIIRVVGAPVPAPAPLALLGLGLAALGLRRRK